MLVLLTGCGTSKYDILYNDASQLQTNYNRLYFKYNNLSNVTTHLKAAYNAFACNVTVCSNKTVTVQQACPECICDDTEVKNYLNRMYSCENKIKYYEGLNNTGKMDNLSHDFYKCNQTLIEFNRTIEHIKDLVD